MMIAGARRVWRGSFETMFPMTCQSHGFTADLGRFIARRQTVTTFWTRMAITLRAVTASGLVYLARPALGLIGSMETPCSR